MKLSSGSSERTRLWVYIILALIGTFFAGNLFAQQQQYTLLKQGDYEIVEENISFAPNAQIHGYYLLKGNMYRQDFFSGITLNTNLIQDFELRVQSKVNSNLSLNIALGNASANIADQGGSYGSNDDLENEPTSVDEGGLNVVFNEAFVEYNHNPNARLLVGLQSFTVGDSDGLVYKGTNTAITQGCGLGTWCYNIGGAKLGDNAQFGLLWGQLTYPVYESGNMITDQWHDQGTRSDISFSVELMQAKFDGHGVPLAEYGGWTGEGSSYQETDNSSDVYFNTNKTEYLGLITKLYYHNWDFNLTRIGISGSRMYYADSVNLGTRAISGYANYLNVGYKFTDELKLSGRLFMASGNSSSAVDTDEWDDNSSAYYEVRKGSYGDALIYFNNDYGTGLGHSVSNLTYSHLNLSYRPSKKLSMDVGLYTFSRTEPVYVQFTGDSTARAVSDIGMELDYTVNWQMERNLKLSAQVALFSAGDAYVDNDNDYTANNVTPKGDFTMLAVSCKYQF